MAEMDGMGALSSMLGGFESFGEAGQLMGQASLLKTNAGLLDVDKAAVLAEGKLTGDALRVQGDKFIARQRAMYSKAGVRFTGSPALVWAETEKSIQLDVLNNSLNATAKANAIGWEQVQLRMAAGRARTAAWGKATEGLLKIGTSVAMSAGTGGGTKGGVKPTAAQAKTFGGSYPGATPAGYKGTIQPFPAR